MMEGHDNLSYVTQSKRVLNKYMDLPIPSDKIQCMYVWIDGTGEQLCAKTQTLTFAPKTVKEVPVWSTCAYPTFHIDLSDSEIYLHPVALYNDPFRRHQNKMVFCETYYSGLKPTATNKRNACMKTMEKIKEDEPWFGFEQEYMLLNKNSCPVGGVEIGVKGPAGKSYFGVGADRVFGRDIQEAHYRACLYAGIQIAGCNVEFMPSQFEFQIGICEGVNIGDDLWMARFILQRVAEDFGVTVTFDPKPFPGAWLGSGCHANFSTKKMRNKNGLKEIERTIECLKKTSEKDIKLYDIRGGKDNLRRMGSGTLATPNFHKFSYGVADRSGSIRIPRHVAESGKGYLEDRRPSSNCDPYIVAEILARSTCLE